MINEKAASQISVIGGADGPTSVFVLKKGKRSFRQKLRKIKYDIRKWFVIRQIKADPHSPEEVIDFLKTEGYRELGDNTKEYQEEYCSMRSSFLLLYEPQLLGEPPEKPKPDKNSTEEAKRYLKQMEERQKAAENISTDLFDIDLHIFEKRTDGASSAITIERKYGYIGGSAVGNTKEFNKLFRRVYLYYGVTQNDIDNQTKRYEELVKVLAGC